MHYSLLFCMIVLNIGTLKTESIDLSRKYGRMELIYPFSRDNVITSHFQEKPFESKVQEYKWNGKERDSQLYSPVIEKNLNYDNDEDYENENQNNDIPEYQFKSIDQLDDAQAARLSKYLIKALSRPTVFETPLILLDDSQDNLEDQSNPSKFDSDQGKTKRARLFMQYPWKRHNFRIYNRMDYDPYNMCSPSKTDFFALLTAIHDARQGDKIRAIKFCNRRRPVKSVYTNIRFLGRKRK